MEGKTVLLLTPAGWVNGMQVAGEEAESKLESHATALRCKVEDLLLLQNCRMAGFSEEVPQVVLRRSAVLGLVLD